MESVKKFFGFGGRRKEQTRKPRRLMLDPLEQRQLLSLTNGTTLEVQTVSDILVNQTPSDSQTTSANRSVASDHNGDVVVAWTRYDMVLDASGNQIVDPKTGSYLTDANIYARYLTNEVQRIVLPSSIFNGSGSGLAKFSMIYGGPAVQKLTFNAPYDSSAGSTFRISGDFKLGFDLNGDGTIAANETTASIDFSEYDWNDTDLTFNSARLMQNALRALGGVLNDVEVKAIGAREYHITFGPGTAGIAQSAITVEETNFDGLAFLPSVMVSSVRQPTAVGTNINSGVPTIVVSPTDPNLTITSIENAFNNNSTGSEDTIIGPVFMDMGMGPYGFGDSMRPPVAQIKVTSVKTVDDPLGLRTFDITYVGNSGDQDQTYSYHDQATGKLVYKPLLQFKDITSKTGTAVTGGTVTIMKVCSPEFRVNPAEPSDPYRPLPGGEPNPNKYQQTQPSVAMDADGDFIITWQSDTPDSITAGSKIDIYAQRFSPAAYATNPSYWVDKNYDGVVDTSGTIANSIGVLDMPIQGVRPLGNAFRVNTFTVDEQTEPSVGMDSNGNFVVSWSNQGQLGSFYNGVMAQRFNRDGDRLGSEFMVNLPNASHHDTSYVSMSADGHFVITYISGGPAIWAKVYDQNGNGYYEDDTRTSWGNFRVSVASPGIDAPSASWDLANNFIIGWDDGRGDDANALDNGATSADHTGNANKAQVAGVYAQMYSLENRAPTDPQVGGELPIDKLPLSPFRIIRPYFRVNSADIGVGTSTDWPGNQQGNQVALDADGDLTIVYSGFGMDVSYNSSASVYDAAIDDPANQDLLQYLEFFLPSGSFNGGDIDDRIEEALWTAQKQGATDAQLGRLYAIYAQQADAVRGSSDGVMFSQWNADPTREGYPLSRLLNVNNTDTTVNSQRSGQNSRVFIAVEKNATQGTLTVRLSTPYLVGPADFSARITFTQDPVPVVDANATRDAIAAALREAPGVGTNWPLPIYESPIDVRLLSEAEETAREGTYWDLSNYDGADKFHTKDSYIYEVIFQGELHDSPVTLSIAPNGNQLKLPGDVPAFAAVDMIAIGNSGNIVQDLTNFSSGEPGSASIGMQPNGSFTVGWTQTNIGTFNGEQNIYIRTFNEATDTAGPLATDFLLPEGTRLKDNGQVMTSLQYLVVSFDENMNTHLATDSPTDWAGSVLNTANWSLLKDGVQINGGINKVYFGLNMASQMNAQLGLNLPGSNKYEAVLLLDANGLSSGITSLLDGHYQIVALNSMHDVAGNPLGRTGFLSTTGNPNGPHIVTDPRGVTIAVPGPNGVNFSRSFDVAAMPSSEVLVNAAPSAPTGSQSTQTTSNTSASAPGTPHAVANDGNGDYVVVWSDTTPGHEGVWAKMYSTTWVQVGTNHQSIVTPVAVINPATGMPWTNNEIQISSKPTDTYASVAMDGDGDFVVTWSRDNTADPVADPNGVATWDVYARRYDAMGQPRTDDPFNAAGNEFRVNTETTNVQRYSDVAIDVDGDFIVTWQSLNQDGSGYGIYAQRYSPSGEVLGGTNEVQQIEFIGRPQGHFKLQWVDKDDVLHTSDELTLPESNNLSLLVPDIQAALTAMGARVIVMVSSDTTISIEFTDVDANTDQSQIVIPTDSVVDQTGDAGHRIVVSTLLEGAPGEFKVNNTTINDQMFPSIAANAKGDFVVTWTGYGQDGDATWESNIYAKKLPSNDVFRSTTNSYETIQTPTTPTQIPIGIPYVVSTDDPANHVVQPGTGYDGVVQVFAGYGAGSGTLLLDGKHILTAAHVVTEGSQALPAEMVSVVFTLPTGPVTVQASQVFVAPNYNGNPFMGGDVAVITLATAAPAGVKGYDIYRKTDEVGKVMDFYGYGNWGTGQTGGDGDTFGTLHHGRNKWEATGDIFAGGYSSDLLYFDFDDGTAARDAFGTDHGIVDTGLGQDEADQAHGDSGGPSFIAGSNVIAAVCTGGAPSSTVDLDGQLGNSTFGEYCCDTRVSVYASWIDSITGGSIPDFVVNSTTANSQKWSSVALNSAGDFVITWTSYGQDGTGSGAGAGTNGMNGVYARKFDSTASALGSDFKVNTFSANNQQRPQIAMTPSGDFDIIWESFQDRAAFSPGSGGNDSPNSYGIYAQRYAGASNTSSSLGPNREIGSEFRLNSTTDGIQRYASIAMDANGDLIAAWTGSNAVDATKTNVFTQRFDIKKDSAGGYVTDVFNVNSTTSAIETVHNGSTISSNVSKFVVAFDENMSAVGGTAGLHSVINAANWQLQKTGGAILNGVSKVEWRYTDPSNANNHRNPATGKFEVVVTFDANPDQAGQQLLAQGLYTVVISESVQDFFGNNIDGDYNGANGGNFTFSFTVDINSGVNTDDPIGDSIANAHTSHESPGAIATTLNGNHVSVWTAYDGNIGKDRVFYKVFNADGTAVTDRLEVASKTDTYYINNALTTFAADDQGYATVACDGDGDFVITWTNTHNGNSDVFVRRFNSRGEALGSAIRANTYTVNEQKWSSVAMDAQGDFIVTWSSYGQEDNNQLGKGFGVYARRFNAVGQALAPEFQVNTTTGGNQQNSTIAMTNDGRFVVAWQTDQIQGQFDIYARIFSADGTPDQRFGTFLTGDQPLNGTQAGNQQNPDIAMNADGSSVVVTWQSASQDGNGWGIYHTGFNILTGFFTILETRVNATTLGDQVFPSVAMAYNGKYVITWSGPGSQAGQADQSGSGVFYREYQANGASMIPETRVNRSTIGDQWKSSVGVDQRGNGYIVFTGPGASAGSTNIYRFIAPDSLSLPDTTGPIVTDIALNNLASNTGSPIIEGSVLSASDLAAAGSATTSLIAYFSENLSTANGISHPTNVLNAQNWRLYRNGVEINKAVINVIFGLDAVTRKYQAILTIDGNGDVGGTTALASGDYQLVVGAAITDNFGNVLDGDLDGIPGVNATVSSQPGYSFNFSVVGGTPAEIRVNNTIGPNQTFSETVGTGLGQEQSHRSVAIDHNGDFATVWTSYGQDDPTDMSGGGIYLRIFDNNNAPLGKAAAGDILVNTTTLGNQHNASVAMSADGNIIVVWQSEGQDPDGSTGIYAQLFDLMGNKIGGQFRVNTNYTNDQFDPAVAADAYGNFAVVWATGGQNSSYFNDVKGQMFDLNGQPVGIEFLVNDRNIPGGSEIHPTVAMNYTGQFVVAWDQVNTAYNGVNTNTIIMARLFDRLGSPNIDDDVEVETSFQVDGDSKPFVSDPEHIADHHVESPLGGNETMRWARNPQAAMDAQGSFIVTWESFRDNDEIEPDPQIADSYGIYYRRFDSAGVARTAIDYQANLTISANDPNADGTHVFYSSAQSALYAGDQVNPTIAMDVDGDYVIAWDGNGAQPNRVSQSVIAWSSLADNQGIFSRTFHAEDPAPGTPEYTSEQTRSNMTSAATQKFPSLAMMPNGEYVVVWCGNGIGDQSGIFARRYKEFTDTAGPLLTRISGADGKTVLNVLLNPDYTRDDVSSQLLAGTDGVKYLTLTFDEAMLEGNPTVVPDSVTNPANYRLMREGDSIPLAIDYVTYGKNTATGKYEAKIFLKQAITLNGTYTLTAYSPKSPTPQKPAGSSGLRDKSGNPMGCTGFDPDGTDYEGEFQVLAGLPNTITRPGTSDPNNQAIQDIQVNDDTLPGLAETTPRIATNANGDYAVVWLSTAVDTAGNIMMRRFDRYGRPLGAEIQVSSIQDEVPTTQIQQTHPDVAVDYNGNIIVTWAGQGVDDMYGVYARIFDIYGNPTGDDFLVNQNIANVQDWPSVDVDRNGNVVFTWTSSGQDSDAMGVFARRFNLAGKPQGNEFLVNSTTKFSQQASDVAMDANGNFTIVWQSDQQDGNQSGIYGQRFNAAGQKLGGEFRINTYTLDKQVTPQVAMDDAGDFMVVWQSFGQDGNGYGVYERRYNAAGTALDANDVRVNKTTVGWQYQPSVSASGDGRFLVTWAGYGQDDPEVKDYGIYAHIYNNNGTDYVDPTTGVTLNEFLVNQARIGNQTNPAATMDANGDMIVAWVGPDPSAPQTIPPTPSTWTAIYARIMALDANTYLPYIPKNSLNAFTLPKVNPDPNPNPTYIISVNGTAGNDTIEFHVGSTLSASTLIVNGAQQSIPATATGFSIDGVGGYDALWFYGGSGALIADLSYGGGTIQFGSYSLVYANMEYDYVKGNSGNDVATIHDSTGNDVLQAGQGFANLSSGTSAVNVAGFKTTTTQATQGNDSATLFDSSTGGSTFSIGPTGGSLVGAGIDNRISGFGSVAAYAAAGKKGAAVFTGAAGKDTFVASYIGAQMFGSGRDYSAWGFGNVQGFSNGADGDKAVFYGAPGGSTTLNMTTTGITETEPNLVNYASGFPIFEAYADPSGNNTANISGSSGNEKFITSPIGMGMSVSGMELSAWGYRNVNINGNGGADTAVMYAADGANTFAAAGNVATLTSGNVVRKVTNVATVTANGNASSVASFYGKQGVTNSFAASPTQSSMSGTGFNNIAKNFGAAQAYAVAGSADSASFTDSAGNDGFVSSPIGVQMFGSGLDISAWGFNGISANSTGGSDTATFYASKQTADAYVANGADVTYSGQGFSRHFTNFAHTETYAAPGLGSTATLSGSAGYDNLIATPSGAQFYGQGYMNAVWGFGSLSVDGKGGNDIATLVGSTDANNSLLADNVFAQLSGSGFDNKVSNFGTVKVRGGNASDAALLDHAYLEKGLLDQPSTATGLTINRKLWLYDFDQLATTEKPTTMTPQPKEVDKLMSAFMFQ
jgi:hypothetical protein